MPDSRKKLANLQKKVKSLRLRITELERNKPQRKQTDGNTLLYQTLMKHINLGITLIDTNYRVVTTNTGQGKILKKPHSKLVGKYCFKEFEKRNAVCPHCPGTVAMATKRPAETETVGVRDDGTHVPARIQAFPILETDGTVKGFLEVVEDITKHKQAEEKLRESEQRFKAVFDNAADGILLADVKNRKFHIGNKTICRMLGRRPEEIKKLTLSNIHPKKHLPYVKEQFEKLVKREITVAEDIPVKRKDGSVFYADISSFTIAFGGKTYLAGIFEDITEHKKAREELRQAEAKYKTLVEQIPAVTYTTALDKSSATAYISPQILKLAGFSPEECAADPDLWSKQLHPEDRQRVLNRLNLSKKSRHPFNCEYRLFNKDGRIVWCRDEAVVVRDSSGRSLMLQGVMFDITAQKRAEEELNVYREKMAHAERLASLGTLSATVAHELTQPLTVIRLSIENSLEDLKAASCPKDISDLLKDGLNEVSHATSVVDRFRNYARQSSRKTLCETAIGPIASKLVRLLGKTAQSAKMTLCLENINELPPVYADEKDIEQLFFALTENAIQAADGKKNHRLIIKGNVKGENIELQFSDNCRGIAPENLVKIFEPFFTTGPDGERTGLGLPIVHRIVSENGGKINVKSQLGKGTTFYITLPITPRMAK